MKNLCKECSNPIDETDSFCRNCGAPIRDQPSSTIHTKTGRESINIGVGNLPSADIHVGDRYEVVREPKDIAYIDRLSTRELKLGNTSLKTSWVIFSGTIGVLGGMASIVSAFVDLGVQSSFIWYLGLAVFGVSFAFLAFGIYLQRFRFLSIDLLNRNLEVSSDGRIFITKVGGSCPKCGSGLRLVKIGPKDNKTTIVVCSRNPDQHRWGFDPTVLPDLPHKRTW